MNRTELLEKYSEPIKVLDQGFIRLVDIMGDDSAILQMARVSYGGGTKATSSDRALIRYLMRHHHSTPFEGCEIKLHVKLPLFIARQWMRHRTWSFNEISARYSVLSDQYYVPAPEQVCYQSTNNKQGRAGPVPEPIALQFIDELLLFTSQQAFESYEASLRINIARETARMMLPVNTYTEFYAKVDLKNLLHFLWLREDSHAQWEIRQYALAIEGIVKDWVPLTIEAWRDYQVESHTFSRSEMVFLRELLSSLAERVDLEDKILHDLSVFDPNETLISKRERTQFLEALTG